MAVLNIPDINVPNEKIDTLIEAAKKHLDIPNATTAQVKVAVETHAFNIIVGLLRRWYRDELVDQSLAGIDVNADDIS